MSATVTERLESLKEFKQISLFSFGMNKRSYRVTFCPIYSFVYIRNSSIPDIVVSFSAMMEPLNKKDFPPKDYMSRIVRKIKSKWIKLGEDAQLEFIDKIPLNTMYMGGDYIG